MLTSDEIYDLMEDMIEVCRCSGFHVGRITAGDLSSGPHFSMYVCKCEAVQNAARRIAREATDLEPEYFPLPT